MIKHIVIWNLKEYALGNNRITNAQIVKERLEALQGKIEGLLKIEVGIDFLNTETSGDIVLYSEFETKEAFYFYQEHPLHKEAGRFIRKVVAFRKSVDYEF
ncbi:MAG: Dabb family protein [Bacteroidales bacterium]